MAIPGSGPLSFSVIRSEFNGPSPAISLSDYYRNGGLVPSAPQNAQIPTSGAISVSFFYGATNEIVAVVSGNVNNLDVSSLFGSNWTSAVPKRLIINSGVVVGSTADTLNSLTIPNTLAGTLTIENNGNVYGAGGIFNGSNGGVGGNAVRTFTPVTIQNNGNIFAGGGAGGRGGQGGTGSCGSTPGSTIFCPGQPNPFACGGGSCAQGGFQSNFCFPLGNCPVWCQARCSPYPCGQNPPIPNPASTGSAGGVGGRGQGSDGPLSPGSATTGTPTNCGGGGTGAPGGTGGSFGQPGASGPVGGTSSTGQGGFSGQPGSAAGFYIVGNSLVNWTNLGSVAGRVS